jgi:hypothetical protein
MRGKPRGQGDARAVSGRVPVAAAPDPVRGDPGGKPPAASATAARAGWPGWARVAISLVLMYHMAALLAGAVGVPPSSELEQRVADQFATYFDLIDTGYSYRFYAEPPPTPVVTATLQFGDGRPEETVRLPGRDLSGPRMRHQRQLALANSLFADVQEARRVTRDPSQSRLARAYARHLCRTRPGCRSVTLHVQQHLIPDPSQVRKAMDAPGASRFDLFGDRMFTIPEWIGDYPCDAF